MVAYSFKQRFVGPIKDRKKAQTIRADRQRHARVGETIQIYTGMRTSHCRLIGLATCKSVQPVRFDFEAREVQVGAAPVLESLPDLDAFAQRDGFDDYRGMCEFWEANHGTVHRFEGVLIEWQDFRLPETAP